MSLSGGKTRDEILYGHIHPESRAKKRAGQKAKPPAGLAVFNRLAIAELLHELLCHASHEAADGECPWYLFDWESPDDLHRTYLKKADALLKVMRGDGTLAFEVIKAITE